MFRRSHAVLIICLLTTGFASWGDAASDKVLTYHLNGPPESLDPAKCSSQRCRRVMWAIYESLLNVGKDSKTIVPELAESWDVSPDGLRYTFRLRKGVTFHDGTPFNATSAKLNLERIFIKENPFYTADPPNVRETIMADLIKDISVQDEQTLTITLKNRKVHMLHMIPMVSLDALRKHGKGFGQHPVGTGPFKFVRSTAEEVRLVANTPHWGGRPRIDGISYGIIPDFSEAIDQFLGGRIDFLPEIEPLAVERIIANPTTKLIRVPTLSLFYLGFRVDRKPFDDIRVRRAFTKAINVERAVLFTARGMAAPAYGPIPAGAEGYDPTLKKSQYAPDAARQLLAQAGHAAGLRVSLFFNGGLSLFTELTQAMQADLAKVGVTVELVPKPDYRQLVGEIRRGTADLFVYAWSTILPDADLWIGRLFPTKSVDNFTHYSSPTVDALLEQARGSSDPAAQEALYRKAQQLIVDDAPMVFLFNEIRVSAYNTRVVGLELNNQSFPVDRFSRTELRAQ